jgi:hypothetical protein
MQQDAAKLTRSRKMKGSDYLQQFALPNFFFFVTQRTTSYVIAACRWKTGLSRADQLALAR